MKRSKIATFKVKNHPKNEKTSKFFQIGDYFTIDFDKYILDLQTKGIVHVRYGNDSYDFYPNEIHMIRISYIDELHTN